jgi:hypothetical protein
VKLSDVDDTAALYAEAVRARESLVSVLADVDSVFADMALSANSVMSDSITAALPATIR